MTQYFFLSRKLSYIFEITSHLHINGLLHLPLYHIWAQFHEDKVNSDCFLFPYTIYILLMKNFMMRYLDLVFNQSHRLLTYLFEKLCEVWFLWVMKNLYDFCRGDKSILIGHLIQDVGLILIFLLIHFMRIFSLVLLLFVLNPI